MSLVEGSLSTSIATHRLLPFAAITTIVSDVILRCRIQPHSPHAPPHYNFCSQHRTCHFAIESNPGSYSEQSIPSGFSVAGRQKPPAQTAPPKYLARCCQKQATAAPARVLQALQGPTTLKQRHCTTTAEPRTTHHHIALLPLCPAHSRRHFRYKQVPTAPDQVPSQSRTRLPRRQPPQETHLRQVATSAVRIATPLQTLSPPSFSLPAIAFFDLHQQHLFINLPPPPSSPALHRRHRLSISSARHQSALVRSASHLFFLFAPRPTCLTLVPQPPPLDPSCLLLQLSNSPTRNPSSPLLIPLCH